MRSGRNQALEEFRLVDEMPFCPEESDLEELTSALDQLMVRRVDQNLLNNKRRRIQSRKTIEKKEIDDVVVKSLMRLCNAVQDCFTYEHQVKVIQKQATTRKIVRTQRESKSKQIYRKRILDEAQQRTKLRKVKIVNTVKNKIEEATAQAIAARQEEVRAQKKEKGHKLLEVAEQEFNRISEYEAETTEKKQQTRRVQSKARVSMRRQQHRDNVHQSIQTLRHGLDELDSAADAMLNRRFVIK